jgi:hypothetical protein
LSIDRIEVVAGCHSRGRADAPTSERFLLAA